MEFRDNLDVAVAIGGELNCRAFNALYGNRLLVCPQRCRTKGPLRI